MTRREAAREEAHFQVLRLLGDNPELSTREIADAVGVSNGSAYYLLKALAEKGFVKFERFISSSHKGRYAYILTPKGLSEKSRLTARFLGRKLKQYEALQEEIAELRRDLEGAGDAGGVVAGKSGE
ncbi:MarR family EPS-associated transcriptional regulator [Maritimibacter sp. HL-12]|uniref:MarR family EPS-associated transcriptional regulator n=1 Tax=Maritimibacter sp. HL-12 TaxID=1162418 RepID=UPI000A0F08DE|nr:MarR family EPS-associated transcriptional regulator [Maritimibacter sp. HL-12]SMH56146.1 EPS-associated transcriptional regulator, MarR family [Maritimibacter sp. HL-12]